MRTKAVSVLLSVLVVFVLGVGAVTLRLRSRIRSEMLEQEGSVFRAVTRFEARRDGEDALGTVLDLVNLEGVVGLRLYSSAGECLTTLPTPLTAGTLSEPTRAAVLRGAGSLARLETHALLDTLFADPLGELTQEPVPLVHVLVQVEPGTMPGSDLTYAEFLVDGAPMAAAFRELDHALLMQSLAALGVGGVMIAVVLMLSLVRLERSNRDLAQANRDLTLHLKAAAVGSVSAHLFHRLKHAVDDAAEDHGAGELQAMVQEVLDLFQDEELGLAYELSGREILELASAPLEALARERGVTVRLDGDVGVRLRNRQGNLLVLAIQNVLRNAIEATPGGADVACSCAADAGATRVRVSDRGTGIGEDEQRYLFEPGYSSKAGGNGLGLSISRQLCRLIGGDLRLAETGEGGTTFELVVKADSPPGEGPDDVS